MGASSRKLLPTAEDATPNGVGGTGRRGVYVYCVVRGATKPTITMPEARLPNAGAPRVLPLGVRTWLVVADVPLDIYGGRAVERRLQDLDWVAACGVAHQAMVAACMRNDAVVPMKVFTIFTSAKRARHEMRRHGDQLRTVMHQVAGCVEWGVRITRAPQPARDLERMTTQAWMQPRARKSATSTVGAASTGEVTGVAQASAAGETDGKSGRAFLQAKARRRNASREAAAVLDQHVRALADTLGGVTRDVRYRDPTRGTVPVLLDASYLVPRRAERRFRAQVRIKSQPLLARGCRVTVTGPWPAYSFVSPAGR
jgi:hypothetical protein